MNNKFAYLYFTLGEIVALEDDTIQPNATIGDIVFTTIMTNYGLTIEDSSSSKQNILNQLIRMVYARFYDC